MNETELKALVEQRKAELAAAQELVYKAEQAEREAARRAEQQARAAKEQEERKAQWAALLPVANKIVGRLHAAGLKEARVDEEGEDWTPGITVCKEDRGYHSYSVKIEPVYGSSSRYSFRHVNPEGWRIVVGAHSGRERGTVRYQIKADGSFNADKLVATVRERVEAERAALERKQRQVSMAAANKELSARLEREFGTENSWRKGSYSLIRLDVSISPSQYVEGAVAVSMDWRGKSMSEAQARRLLALLAEFKAEDEAARQSGK